jgi:hypothetical protein
VSDKFLTFEFSISKFTNNFSLDLGIIFTGIDNFLVTKHIIAAATEPVPQAKVSASTPLS